MTDIYDTFADAVADRLAAIKKDMAPIHDAITHVVATVRNNGVVHAFGTGHSEAFAMEIAGRAGGLIPTNRIPLRDVVLHGTREASALNGSTLERDGTVIEELLACHVIDPRDMFIIASNSGVNASIVGMALAVKKRGLPLVAVTSLDHSTNVPPLHDSGRKLYEIADVVIDNRAPRGDTVLTLEGGAGVGAVSSITAAYIAQLITIGAADALNGPDGQQPPLYLSANIPGGSDHNEKLEARYQGRIRRDA